MANDLPQTPVFSKMLSAVFTTLSSGGRISTEDIKQLRAHLDLGAEQEDSQEPITKILDRLTDELQRNAKV